MKRNWSVKASGNINMRADGQTAFVVAHVARLVSLVLFISILLPFW